MDSIAYLMDIARPSYSVSPVKVKFTFQNGNASVYVGATVHVIGLSKKSFCFELAAIFSR